MRWTVATVAVAGALLFGARGDTQPAGCAADMVGDFELRNPDGSIAWGVPAMECVQYFDVVVNTPYGERHIRGIGDINADTFMPRGAIAAIEAGVRQTAARMRDLGDYKIPNVTILMTGVAAVPSERVGDTWKHTNVAADANPERMAPSGRCPVRLFVLNPMTNDDMKKALAHELFHCVQFGSLAPAQIAGAANWWLEGSAELFSVYVFPERTAQFNRESHFRASVEEQKPIFQMDYEAVFPFLHYNQRSGIGRLVPLLRTMPSSRADSAQRAALRGMMGNEEWLKFAQAFDDRQIRYPNGRTADFGAPVEGERWRIATTSTQTRTLKPFVISPGHANYDCGVWNNRLNPTAANISVRKDGTGAWASWPAETDCRSAGSVDYRTMAIETGDANRTVSLRAERRIACNNCLAGETHIDPCLVGTWEQTGGGPLEYLRRMGVPFTRDNMGSLRLSMRDDGTFTSQSVGVNYQVTARTRRGPVTGDTIGNVAGTAGRWSAKDGQIRSCFDSGGQPDGKTTVTYPNGKTYNRPMDGPGVGGISGTASYQCTATTLTTTNPTRYGDMRYTFRRTSPPPRTPTR